MKSKGKRIKGLKGKCKFCGRNTFLQKHHIIPKSKWKGSKVIIYLCSNCHTNLHKKGNKK